MKTKFSLFGQNRFARFFTLVSLLSVNFIGYSQQPQWYIKNTENVAVPTGAASKLIDFRNNPVSVNSTNTLISNISTAIYEQKEADNAIYDENGNLEIFIAHDEVFDATGTNIYRLTDENFGTFSNPGLLWLNDYDMAVCRVPLSCTKYYIFRYSNDGGVTKLHYYIYDISTHTFVDPTGAQYDNISIGNGDVDGIKINLPSVNQNGEVTNLNLSISKLNSANERFLFFDNEHGVSIATITNSGVNYSAYPWSSNHTSGYLFPKHLSTNYAISGSPVCETEVIQVPNDGTYRVTRTSETSGVTKIYVINVENNGLINATDPYHVYTTVGQVKGLEFSPDGNHLYISKTEQPYLQYVDVTSQTNPITDLLLPPSYNSNTYKENFKIGSIEMAHDGKMYFASNSGMSSFSDPNHPVNASIASNWINNDIPVIADKMIYVVGGNPQGIDHDLIPLPEQVDGELLYTPITAGPFIGCGSAIPTGCVEDYFGFEYLWYDNGVNVASGPCFTPPAYGIYQLEVRDENGCIKTYDVSFENDLPVIPELNDVVYCSLNGEPGLLGWFGELPFMNEVTGIDWTVNGNPVSTGPIDFQIPYSFNGVYTATVYSACGSQTFSFTVSDILLQYVGHPLAYFDTKPGQPNFGSVTFEATTTGPNYSHEWHVIKNGNSSPLSYNDHVTDVFQIGDVFTVQLTVIDYAWCKTYRFTDSFIPGFKSQSNDNNHNGLESDFKLSIYPHPATDISNVVIENGNAEQYSMQVINLDGKIVIDQQVATNSRIDFSHLSKGVYFIQISDGVETRMQKMIKN